mmetsp:Transcript_1031/g.2016  ORF Transcript_1031/g.2016 Transcript_1031/m.2016 type:complete len:247 (-) Transcript_1031:403-1143(-)
MSVARQCLGRRAHDGSRSCQRKTLRTGGRAKRAQYKLVLTFCARSGATFKAISRSTPSQYASCAYQLTTGKAWAGPSPEVEVCGHCTHWCYRIADLATARPPSCSRPWATAAFISSASICVDAGCARHRRMRSPFWSRNVGSSARGSTCRRLSVIGRRRSGTLLEGTFRRMHTRLVPRRRVPSASRSPRRSRCTSRATQSEQATPLSSTWQRPYALIAGFRCSICRRTGSRQRASKPYVKQWLTAT